MVGVESGDSLDAVAELRAPALQLLDENAARLPLLLLLDGVQDRAYPRCLCLVIVAFLQALTHLHDIRCAAHSRQPGHAAA